MKDTFIRENTQRTYPMPPGICYMWKHVELNLGIFGNVILTFQDDMCHKYSHDTSSNVTSSFHVNLEDCPPGYHIISEFKKSRSAKELNIKG
jgi:hypothetical protein